jgi:hypothetical protein
MAIHNEKTLSQIETMDIACGLLRDYIVTQIKTSPQNPQFPNPYNAFTQVQTIINNATAVQANMIAYSNWSQLP